MSIAAAIRVFDPRTQCLHNGGRGRASIHWDDIAAMLARVESDNPVGYQLLMTIYRGDVEQEKALRTNLYAWAICKYVERDDIVQIICQVTLDIMLRKPLTPQKRGLRHLHRSHGGYARREANRILKLKAILRRERLKPESPERYDRIHYLEQQISGAKRGINDWVYAHSDASTRCPRCKGSGTIVLPAHGQCPACAGQGWFKPSRHDIRRHIAEHARTAVTAGEITKYLPLIDECRAWLSDQIGTSIDKLHELFEANADAC